jgi:hypothetical protein
LRTGWLAALRIMPMKYTIGNKQHSKRH